MGVELGHDWKLGAEAFLNLWNTEKPYSVTFLLGVGWVWISLVQRRWNQLLRMYCIDLLSNSANYLALSCFRRAQAGCDTLPSCPVSAPRLLLVSEPPKPTLLTHLPRLTSFHCEQLQLRVLEEKRHGSNLVLTRLFPWSIWSQSHKQHCQRGEEYKLRAQRRVNAASLGVSHLFV